MWPLFNQETCLQRCRGAVFWQESCPFSFMTRNLKRRRQQREPLKAIRIITNFVVSIALRILEFSVPPIIQSSGWGRDYANHIATCSSSFARSRYPLNGGKQNWKFLREQPRKLRWRVFSFSLREGLTVEIACYGGDLSDLLVLSLLIVSINFPATRFSVFKKRTKQPQNVDVQTVT